MELAENFFSQKSVARGRSVTPFFWAKRPLSPPKKKLPQQRSQYWLVFTKPLQWEHVAVAVNQLKAKEAVEKTAAVAAAVVVAMAVVAIVVAEATATVTAVMAMVTAMEGVVELSAKETALSSAVPPQQCTANTTISLKREGAAKMPATKASKRQQQAGRTKGQEGGATQTPVQQQQRG
jgi:hypothetical protein